MPMQVVKVNQVSLANQWRERPQCLLPQENLSILGKSSTTLSNNIQDSNVGAGQY